MIAQGLSVPKTLQSSAFGLYAWAVTNKRPLPAAAAAPAGEAPPRDCRFSQLDFRCAVE